MLTADQLAGWTGGRWRGGQPDKVAGVHFDTRQLVGETVFIALRGDARDGHDFLDAAMAGGAVGAIVEATSAGVCPEGLPCLLVKDTRRALRDLACAYRATLDPRVIAVTGSVGKSTVKEMAAQMLASSRPTACSRGNWNNDIGLPVSILGMPADTEAAVLELGMNHPGEIADLASIAAPSCGVVTNVGPVHQEFFDSVEAIAREKAALLEALPTDGLAVLNRDCDYFDLLERAAPCPVLTVSTARDADLRCIEQDPGRHLAVVHDAATGVEIPLHMPLPGDFNVLNAMLAAGAVRWCGGDWAEIQAALESYTGLPLRWRRHEVGGLVLTNDAYNANPVSMRASARVFCDENRRHDRWLVLGGMLELGRKTKDEHLDLGRFLSALPWQGLITVGEEAAWIADGLAPDRTPEGVVYRCETHEDAARLLRGEATPGSAVLLKGSRPFELERVIDALETQVGESHE